MLIFSTFKLEDYKGHVALDGFIAIRTKFTGRHMVIIWYLEHLSLFYSIVIFIAQTTDACSYRQQNNFLKNKTCKCQWNKSYKSMILCYNRRCWRPRCRCFRARIFISISNIRRSRVRSRCHMFARSNICRNKIFTTLHINTFCRICQTNRSCCFFEDILSSVEYILMWDRRLANNGLNIIMRLQ